MKKEQKQDILNQLSEAYNSIQQLDIQATAANISALERAMGLMRYVFSALEGITEEEGENVQS